MSDSIVAMITLGQAGTKYRCKVQSVFVSLRESLLSGSGFIRPQYLSRETTSLFAEFAPSIQQMDFIVYGMENIQSSIFGAH